MTTSLRDRQFVFQGLSIADQATASVSQINYGGFSMTNFTNLRAFDPQIATSAQIARVLGTLIQDLFKQP